MILTIIILSYLLWLNDIFKCFGEDESSTLLITSALITLVSWQVSVPWGITMCCIGSVISIIAIIKNMK